jgi:hypothetical protein
VLAERRFTGAMNRWKTADASTRRNDAHKFDGLPKRLRLLIGMSLCQQCNIVRNFFRLAQQSMKANEGIYTVVSAVKLNDASSRRCAHAELTVETDAMGQQTNQFSSVIFQLA